MEEIYRRFSRRETSFENTLVLLQELLNERLTSDYRRIWVQASNSGRTRFCFTFFPNTGQYRMRFLETGSFRQFRSDGNFEEEMRYIESFIESLRDGLLSGIVE